MPRLYGLGVHCLNCEEEIVAFCSANTYKQYLNHIIPLPEFCNTCRPLLLGVKSSERSKRYTDNRPIGYKSIDRDGYVNIKVSEHPTLYRLEHKVVMERLVGRPLKPYESVHHKDGDRANNSDDNLELWISNHCKGVRASDIRCPHCGKPFYPLP